jgi:1-acyl-sn-glycerol-3-phosphate acyltransferase
MTSGPTGNEEIRSLGEQTRQIFRDSRARGCLLGLAFFMFLVPFAVLSATNYAVADTPEFGGFVLSRLLWALFGVAVGCGLSALQTHSERCLGLVPYAATGFAIVAAVALWFPHAGVTHFLLGMTGGIAIGGMTAGYLRTPLVEMLHGSPAIPIVIATGALALAGIVAHVAGRLGGVKVAVGTVLMVVLLAAGFSWWWLLRAALEQLIEILLWPCYRVRAHGPGTIQPRTGPLIVIANHTAWLDPLWLAKAVDRSLTPMMTSRYYDVPILHWLMANVARAIRVPAATFRRDVPEISLAVKVLDRGGCLVIFPEGSMRRKEERPLRPFGQGVWRILHERPETPVLVCWIEGGWGSFTSYCGGPPMRQKRLDWRRPIDIAMEEPIVLDPTLIKDQRAARIYLMEQCLKARSILGLEPHALGSRPDDEQEESESRSNSEEL